MKKFSALAFLVGLATLVAVVAWRLSVDALALIVGIVLGVIIMTPVVALIAWTARSNRHSSEPYVPPMPPVIVVQPGATPEPGYIRSGQTTPHPALLPPANSQSLVAPAVERHWVMRVFGEEEADAPDGTHDWPP